MERERTDRSSRKVLLGGSSTPRSSYHLCHREGHQTARRKGRQDSGATSTAPRTCLFSCLTTFDVFHHTPGFQAKRSQDEEVLHKSIFLLWYDDLLVRLWPAECFAMGRKVSLELVIHAYMYVRLIFPVTPPQEDGHRCASSCRWSSYECATSDSAWPTVVLSRSHRL